MTVRKSLAWTYGGQIVTFVLTFGTSVIMARLLSPREFGIYATAFAISGILSAFTSFGVASYVIREGKLTRELLRATFTANAFLAIFLAISLLIISLVPRLLDRDVAWVVRLLALNPLIGLFEFVPGTLLVREMRFGTLSLIALLRSVVGAVTTVILAFFGFAAASFALGGLAGYIASAAVLNVLRRADFMMAPTLRGLRPIMVFGFQMMSISGVTQLATRLSDLVISKFLGLAALGLYSRASGLTYQIHNSVYGIAQTVLFSKMSDELRDTGEIDSTYTRSVEILTAIMWPLVIGFAVLARPFIYFVYGEKWLGAATPLTMLMIAQFILFGFAMNWELFVLRKETARQTRFELMRAAVGTIAFTIGATFSISGAAVGRVVEALFGYVLYRPHMDRLAGTAPGRLERIYMHSVALTVAATAPSLVLMLITDWAANTSVPLILSAVAFGGLLWAMTLKQQDHPLLDEVVALRSKLGHSRPFTV